MARLDDVPDAQFQATIVRDVPRWNGDLYVTALETPETTPLALSSATTDYQRLVLALDKPTIPSPPETGYPAKPDGSDESDNRQAIEAAALHRLGQRMSSQVWQPDVGLNLRAIYGQPIPPDDVTDIVARALRPDADWYRVVDASWRYYEDRRRDWIVVQLIATDESDPAPIFVQFEVS